MATFSIDHKIPPALLLNLYNYPGPVKLIPAYTLEQLRIQPPDRLTYAQLTQKGRCIM